MATQRFRATIVQAGSRTVIVLPFDPNEIWGSKQRHHVTGAVNGHPYRGPLGSDGTQYFLPLGAAWRRDSGLEAGAAVDIELSAEGPQTEKLAADINAALEAEPQAKAFFDSLATFYRKNYMRWVDSAKRPETRAARIQEMVALLKKGEKQK